MLFYFYIIFKKFIFSSSLFLFLIFFPLLSFFYTNCFIEMKKNYNVFFNEIPLIDFITYFFCGLIPLNIYCILLIIVKSDSIVGFFCLFLSVFHGAFISTKCLILYLTFYDNEINKYDKFVLFIIFFVPFLFFTLYLI